MIGPPIIWRLRTLAFAALALAVFGAIEWSSNVTIFRKEKYKESCLNTQIFSVKVLCFDSRRAFSSVGWSRRCARWCGLFSCDATLSIQHMTSVSSTRRSSYNNIRISGSYLHPFAPRQYVESFLFENKIHRVFRLKFCNQGFETV